MRGFHLQGWSVSIIYWLSRSKVDFSSSRFHVKYFFFPLIDTNILAFAEYSHRVPQCQSPSSPDQIFSEIFSSSGTAAVKSSFICLILSSLIHAGRHWKKSWANVKLVKMVQQCIITHGMWTLLYGQYPIRTTAILTNELLIVQF